MLHTRSMSESINKTSRLATFTLVILLTLTAYAIDGLRYASAASPATPSGSNGQCPKADPKKNEVYDSMKPTGKFNLNVNGAIVTKVNLHGKECDYDVKEIKSAGGVSEVKATCTGIVKEKVVCKCKSYLDDKGKKQSCEGGSTQKQKSGPTTSNAPANTLPPSKDGSTPKTKDGSAKPKTRGDTGSSALNDALNPKPKEKKETSPKTTNTKDPSGTNEPKKQPVTKPDIDQREWQAHYKPRPTTQSRASSKQYNTPAQKRSANTFAKPKSATRGGFERGVRTVNASFYGRGEKRGVILKHTANGERFNPNAMTFALPLRLGRLGGTYRVCSGSRCVIARANDRGNFGPGNKYRNRGIDLSAGLFRALGGNYSRGLLRVSYTRIR